jgi:DNA-binding beta-propeller fold protein YncE
MTTAWDIGTAVYSSAFSVSAQETDPQALAFSSDGTKMYVMGASGDDINQYALSTAWDITTAVYQKVLSVSVVDSAPQALDFNDDGTKMYLGGSTNNTIGEYQLTTPWDIGTATFIDLVSIFQMSTFVEGGFSGIYVNESVGKAWISAYGNDRVFELSIDTPATKLYGSKWIADPDFHFKNDIVGYKNQRLIGNLYVQGGGSAFNSNLTVAGTLTVNGLLRGEMGRQSNSTAQTINSADDGFFIRHTGTGQVDYTCSSGIPDGHQVTFVQHSTGQIRFVGGSGVTIRSKVGATPRTAGQFSAATLVAFTTSEYYIIGDIVA